MKKEKILNLFVGSNNQGKIKEIRDLLPKRVEIITPKHVNLKSPRETGKTFKENAIIKSKFGYYKLLYLRFIEIFYI